MKRIMLVSLLVLAVASSSNAENNLLEKKKAEAFEKFVASSRKSDGDYSTISLKNWRRDLDEPVSSAEDMIRKVLNTFELHYKNLKVLDYLVTYSSKPTGGIDYDFLIIHHELKPQKVYRFGTKETAKD